MLCSLGSVTAKEPTTSGDLSIAMKILLTVLTVAPQGRNDSYHGGGAGGGLLEAAHFEMLVSVPLSVI